MVEISSSLLTTISGFFEPLGYMNRIIRNQIEYYLVKIFVLVFYFIVFLHETYDR